MKTTKMKSLNEFKLSQSEMNNTQGGLFYGHGVAWSRAEPYDVSYQTGDIGTYVDGVSMGTDGYED